ncbi:MAG: TolC family protein [Candidatus Brocadiia bacterium]
MSRSSWQRIPAAVLLPILAVGLSLGCRRYFSEDRFMTLRVPESRLREIDAVDLQDMAEPDAPEPAEPRPGPGEPPERLELALEECRAGALRHNLDLDVQLRAPAIAAESVNEAEAGFEPALFGNAAYARVEQPTATELSAAESKSYRGDLGVRIPLRTGGDVVFDLAANRLETSDPFSTLNPSYGSSMTASISQPLLRDAGVRTNTHLIRIARYETQQVEARTKLEVIRVLAAVERVYWRLYAARRELEVRKNEYDLAVAQLGRARRRADVGEAAEVEVIRAEAGVAERLEGIIIADNRVRDRERELKRVLNRPGLSIGGTTQVIPVTEPDPVRYHLDVERLTEFALTNRMEMLELELQIAADQSAEAFARNQTLPLVAVDYTYGISGLGDTPGDAFDLMCDCEFDSHQVGLSLSVPLGNRLARSRLRRAVFTRLQRLASQARRSAQIQQEVADAADQLDATWQRILASRQGTILAARTLDAEERQFELGLRTSTEVLEAQTRLADAQSAEIRAVAEYQIAQVDLAFAVGALLGESRVRWSPIRPEAN